MSFMCNLGSYMHNKKHQTLSDISLNPHLKCCHFKFLQLPEVGLIWVWLSPIHIHNMNKANQKFMSGTKPLCSTQSASSNLSRQTLLVPIAFHQASYRMVSKACVIMQERQSK